MDTINYQLGYSRQPSRVVDVGGLKIGGGLPVRIQSMLSTPTNDIVGCLAEIQALDRAGCELIRLTVPSRKDLAAVHEIRRLMREEGIARPLVADVHFSPQLAVDACELFEKVRINPGNFSDRPKSGAEWSRPDFEEGHEKLKKAIIPLVDALNKYGRALRIGVNHGSLSTRMIERYGDSPLGMVQSALEMIDLLEERGFHRIVVSLKSSNPIVVQKAYRLLLEKQAGSSPVALHLGVTEAGNQMMGRIKSLVGIGVLLADGIGDTIRVSLTEPGPNEIRFARVLLASFTRFEQGTESNPGIWKRPINHQRRLEKPLDCGSVILGDETGVKIGLAEGTDLPACEFEFEPDFTYRTSGEDVYPGASSRPLQTIRAGEKPISDQAGGLLIQADTPLYELRRMNQSMISNDLPVGLMIPAVTESTDLFWDIQLAGLLSEGLVDFLLLPRDLDEGTLTRFLCMLQATRVRLFTTDYIICPSCGRTLFDIEQTAAEIKQHTHHLKGLKIGVMGCIVNGPGEMADADFGYVGSGAGKVDLYHGQSRVRRGIDEHEAVEKLIDLIKEKGKWLDPQEKS